MKLFIGSFYIFLVVTVAAGRSKKKGCHFPEDFMFGAASAAYQIEGGWDADGKGPSIWDDFVHLHPEKIKDHSNADVGPNSYEHFLEDIQAVKNLNMSFYRFSISWPRVIPTGNVMKINEKGIEYYNKIIDKLLELRIEPMVTMYHWDLPSELQRFGGWTNAAIVDYFEAYANLLFKRFGDRVRYWITFNEPSVFCLDGYGNERDAPAMNFSGIAEYLCGHNVLKSHAVVYELYRKSYHDHHKGKVGIALSTMFHYSKENDKNAVKRAMHFGLGWFANPIFSRKGDYPSSMVEAIDKNRKREGSYYSRLPVLSREWVRKIRGSADFLGLNYYTSRYVELLDKPEGPNPSYTRDRGLKDIVKPEWKHGASDWLYSVPKGMGDLLRWVKKEYDNPKVFITENGWSDDGEQEDNDRIEYLHDHLEQMQEAIVDDKVDVRGYTVWSLIDNFEWRDGYIGKFGVYSVDMKSPQKERKAKKSVEFMKKVTQTYKIPKLN